MLKTFSEGISTGETFATIPVEKSVLGSPAGQKLLQEYTKELMKKGIKQKKAKKLVENLLRGRTFSGEILQNETTQQIKALKKILRSQQSVKIKSTATKLAKHLISKEGLKASAKTVARVAGKLLKVLSSPYLWHIIWSPEIIDIATSKDVRKVWKNMKSEKWWKEAKKRDIEARKKVKTGKEPFSEPSPSIPLGEYYHKDKGWY